MNKSYNFYNIEASFKQYLLAENKPVTVKNYLSDLRHFLGWLVIMFKINFKTNDIIPLINPKSINDYKNYLIQNTIPYKTINRRLSTIRKFCTFCIFQGWMKQNPAKQIQNIQLDINNILNLFEKDLIKEGINSSNIKSYLKDLQEFISI